MSKSEFNIFENIKSDDRKLLRKMIISNILATDMKEHFDMIKAYEIFLEKSKSTIVTEEQSILIRIIKF